MTNPTDNDFQLKTEAALKDVLAHVEAVSQGHADMDKATLDLHLTKLKTNLQAMSNHIHNVETD